MISKLIKQIIICAGLVFALYFAGQSDISAVKKVNNAVTGYMNVNYTMEDIIDTAEKIYRTVLQAGIIDYGEPIDEVYEGEQTPVYAVAGGQVTASGENEEIGKYVKIVHGDGSESLYGNLKSVSVSVPANVRKGQIIGIYEDIKDKEFYYSLKEFR